MKDLDMGMEKVVSFDVEGTLVTPDFSYAIWFEAIPRFYAQQNGVDFAQAKWIVEQEYQKAGALGLEWYDIRYFFRKLDLDVSDSMIERYQSKVCYYPEVKDVLASLHGKYKLVVASSSQREFLCHLLRDIEPCFAEIFSSVSDYEHLKTPEFYLNICRAMGTMPEQVIHIGDNWQSDFVSPTQAGIHAFYLDREGQADCQNSLLSLEQLKVHLLD